MTEKSVDFYFDFASPYAYLASVRVPQAAAEWGRPVLWRPILLGAIIKQIDGQLLSSQPLKFAYSGHDMARTARRQGVPFRMPEVFPFNSIAAARGFYWLQQTHGVEVAIAFAQGVFNACFGAAEDITEGARLAALAEAAGGDGQAMLAGSGEDAIKIRLRHETEQAQQRGVFGAPFFFVDNEPFWGQDRLDTIGEWLRCGGW